MRRLVLRLRQASSESGASLVMVIVFVMVFSVLMASLLELTSTGLRTTSAYADVGDEQRLLDSAMEGAINAIRGSSTSGLQDADCDDFVYESVTVTCTAVGDDVLDGGIEDLMPKYAILALGTGACDGLELRGGTPMAVSGGVWSNSRIAVNERINSACDPVSGNNTTITVFGDVYARHGWCSDDTKLIAAGAGMRDCDRPADEPTPPYLPGASNIVGMTADPAATCTTPAGIVAFSPGLYTELPKYHAARAGCSGSTWWFQPGIYYFDFPATEAEWAINPHNVVGGTPKGWTASTLPALVPLRDACVDPGVEDTPPSPGVQFIFGGTSRISTQGSASATTTGIIELCAGEDPMGEQRIAVFALPSTQSDTRSVVTGTSSQRVATAVSATTGTWTPNAAAGQTMDTTSAVATLRGNGEKVAALSYSAFDDVTAGSLISNVYVDVRHAESGTTSKVSLSLKLRYDKGAAACPGVSPLDVTTGTCTATISVPNITTGLPANPAAIDVASYLRSSFRYADVNSLTAELSATAPTLTYTPPAKLPTEPPCTSNPLHAQCQATEETATVTVDGVRLRVEHTTPGYRAQSSGADPFLLTTSNPVAIFRGTFFAPTADLRLNVHNAGETVFSRGVVARKIAGSVSSSSQQEDSPFALPGLTLRREVVFEAKILDGDVRLRTRVAYDDSDSLFGRAVEILDWVLVR